MVQARDGAETIAQQLSMDLIYSTQLDAEFQHRFVTHTNGAAYTVLGAANDGTKKHGSAGEQVVLVAVREML